MLSTHCIKFSDYEVTLAQITALANFTLAFGSIGDNKNRDRFKFLRPVYVILNKAHDHLKDHYLSLSLSEKLDLVIHNLADINKKQLRCITKLIVAERHWSNVDLLMPHELADGIIRYAYEDKDIIFKNDVKMKTSIFSKWIQLCAQHYDHAIKKDDDGSFIKKDIFPLYILDSKEKITEVREAFAKSNNYLTYRVNQKDSPLPLVQERTNLDHDLIYLTYMQNAILFFMTHLERKLDTLGQVYATDPHHCEFLFKFISKFNLKLQTLTQSLMTKIEVMNTGNEGNLIDRDQLVYREQGEILERISKQINNDIKFLTSRHEERLAVRQIKKERIDNHVHKVDVTKDSLLTLAFLMTQVFDIDTGFVAVIKSTHLNSNLVTAALKETAKTSNEIKSQVADEKNEAPPHQQSEIELIEPNLEQLMAHTGLLLSQPQRHSPSSSEHKPEEPDGVPEVRRPSIIPVRVVNPSVPIIEPAPPQTPMLLLCSIETKLEELKTSDAVHYPNYEKMFRDLKDIYFHLDQMLAEKEEKRHDKADKSIKLFKVLCTRTLEYFNSERTMRESAAFGHEIHDMLLNSQNRKFLDSRKHFGFFPTKTREEMDKFSHACEELTRGTVLRAM